MNRKQRTVIAIASLFLVLSGLFLPFDAEYRTEGDNLKKFMGYRLAFDPPSELEMFLALRGDRPKAIMGTTVEEITALCEREGDSAEDKQAMIGLFLKDQEKADSELLKPLLRRVRFTVITSRVWLQIGLIVATAAGGVLMLGSKKVP